MAPPVLGLYDPALLGDVGEAELAQVWGKDHLPQVDNLHGFVSHIHQDHMALLPSLREGLPVWMHRDAYAVYEGVVAAGEYDGTQADIRLIDDGQIVDFGTFRIEFIEVDHDSPGLRASLFTDRSIKLLSQPIGVDMAGIRFAWIDSSNAAKTLELIY